MQYRELGRTGMRVSRLCFGALTIGPLQAKLPLVEGVRVIEAAIGQGVNFIDTAQSYGTYPYIREALRGRAEEIWVASKSYDYEYDGMRRSVENALRETGRDTLGLFMLHEQETRLTLDGHRPALEYLVHAKKAGMIRAVGVSTHAVEVVAAAADMPEIDVIHPLINLRGIGILDGTRDAMLQAIHRAKARGKGIYGMKPLGGGNLIGEAAAAFRFVLENPDLDAIAVGMQSLDEVALNAALFSGGEATAELWQKVQGRRRRLHIEDWCIGCGACVARCPQGALSLRNGRSAVDPSRCVLCGYCSAACRDFCIKVV